MLAAAADAVGNETDAAVREAKPSTPRSILRRDVPYSSTTAEGATRKRVTFEVREKILKFCCGREDALRGLSHC